MAISLTKINDLVANLANKEVDLGGSAITVALSNTAPGSESSNPTADGNGVLANVTLCTGHANTDSKVVTVTSAAQTSGTLKLILEDKVITASGSVGPFRYIYLYDDSSTGDMLIGVYDYGSSITLENSGDTLTLNFDDTNGVLTIA